MCGQSYLTSARIASEATGPCEGYAVNEEPFLNVIRMHRDATQDIDSKLVPAAVLESAKQCWEQALALAAPQATATRRPRCLRRREPSVS